VYVVDPLICPKCGSEMKIIAMIMDHEETKNILHHLIKTGKSPPGFDPSSLNLFFLWIIGLQGVHFFFLQLEFDEVEKGVSWILHQTFRNGKFYVIIEIG